MFMSRMWNEEVEVIAGAGRCSYMLEGVCLVREGRVVTRKLDPDRSCRAPDVLVQVPSQVPRCHNHNEHNTPIISYFWI